MSPAHRALLQRCGAIILFFGICLGALIYWSPPPVSDAPVYTDSALSPDDSRRYAHDTEVYFGKTGLLADKWTRMWNKPGPLAAAIVVISALGAGVCFLTARRRE